jgi:putative CocE/NonD family hydrolase
MIRMRDGVQLSTDLHFPVGAAGKLPTILVRTPYSKRNSRSVDVIPLFVGEGYVFAIQDMRGRYESEGAYQYLDASVGPDGYDTLSWIAAQPWSNGKIGTFGCSGPGDVQIHLARLRHPNHAAMIPQGCALGPTVGTREGGAVLYADWAGFFRIYGGKQNVPPTLPKLDLAQINRHLPLIDALRNVGKSDTEWEGIVSTEPGDKWWERFGPIRDSDRFDVPALHMTTWYDPSISDDLNLFKFFERNSVSPRARENQFLIVGPRGHCNFGASEHTIVGNRDVGDARFDFESLYVRWFDHWLKGIENGVTTMPKAQFYVMGANRWRREPAWPPPTTVSVRHYLRSKGHANSRFGSGTLSDVAPEGEPSDRYTYDPRTPVPSIGHTFGAGLSGFPAGAFDQSDVEMRNDVLVYSTPPLQKGLEIAGASKVILYVSSSARDTDFTVKLVDVYPDGTAYNLQDTILRARYREGYGKKVWMEPGAVYRLELNLHAVSNYFAPGHQVRLEVSSSNFPAFDRNLNTGGNNYDETRWIVASNTIHHQTAHASQLILNVVP